MIQIRKSADRGHFDHGWLDTYHTFSFAGYQDPAHMGFRTLRVINEDRVQPGEGFGTHAHRDMEIISYPLSGVLSHRDSMGNGSLIREDEIQYMSAGSGVTHSEFNGSETEVAHFLQIWIVPDRKGYEPAYAQQALRKENLADRLGLLASGGGEEGSIRIRQDVKLFAGRLAGGASWSQPLAQGRYGWIQVLRGALTVNQLRLEAGDGASVSDETELRLVAGQEGTEVLFFDLN